MHRYAEYRYVECCFCYITVLIIVTGVLMLGVVMLNIVATDSKEGKLKDLILPDYTGACTIKLFTAVIFAVS